MEGRTFLTARPHLETETALPRPINRIVTANNVRVFGQCPSSARGCALASSPRVPLRLGRNVGELDQRLKGTNREHEDIPWCASRPHYRRPVLGQCPSAARGCAPACLPRVLLRLGRKVMRELDQKLKGTNREHKDIPWCASRPYYTVDPSLASGLPALSITSSMSC